MGQAILYFPIFSENKGYVQKYKQFCGKVQLKKGFKMSSRDF